MVRVCHPLGDGISSVANLLDSLVLRVAIWLVAIVTCGGNAFVIVCRLLYHDEHNSHSLFIKYLAGKFTDFQNRIEGWTLNHIALLNTVNSVRPTYLPPDTSNLHPGKHTLPEACALYSICLPRRDGRLS